MPYGMMPLAKIRSRIIKVITQLIPRLLTCIAVHTRFHHVIDASRVVTVAVRDKASIQRGDFEIGRLLDLFERDTAFNCECVTVVVGHGVKVSCAPACVAVEFDHHFPQSFSSISTASLPNRPILASQVPVA